MTTINIVIPIHPVAKQRARQGINRHTKRKVWYTPNETARFEMDLAVYAKRLFGGGLLRGSLGLDVTCYIKRPKTVKRKYPNVKPDADNYLKAICDSLRGILYKDDSEIIDKRVRKFYADERLPCVEIMMWIIE